MEDVQKHIRHLTYPDPGPSGAINSTEVVDAEYAFALAARAKELENLIAWVIEYPETPWNVSVKLRAALSKARS